MFTRNWYKALAAVATKTSGKDTYISVDGISTNSIAESEYYIQYGRDSDVRQCPSIYRLRTAYTGNGGIILGTGTTPPTMNDCKLSGDLVTGYIYAATVQTNIDDYGATTTAMYTITNTSNKTITIGEIGMIAQMSSTGAGTSQTHALLERTVLDVPLTIEPEGVGQLTYTIRFNHPTS